MLSDLSECIQATNSNAVRVLHYDHMYVSTLSIHLLFKFAYYAHKLAYYAQEKCISQ